MSPAAAMEAGEGHEVGVDIESAAYWQPGAAKPGKKRSKSKTNKKSKDKRKQKPGREGGSAATPGKSELSEKTMAMKFMVRKQQEAESKKEEDERAARLAASHWTAVPSAAAGGGVGGAGGTPRLMVTREVHGAQTLSLAAAAKTSTNMVAISRRSFGGANSAVENHNRRAIAAGSRAAGAEYAARHEVDGEGMLERYEKYIGLPTNRQQPGPRAGQKRGRQGKQGGSGKKGKREQSFYGRR